MAVDGEADTGTESKKSIKGPLMIGVILSLVGAGGGFGFTSGILTSGDSENPSLQPISGDLAFVPIEPMTISIGEPSKRRFLKFRGSLEVDKSVQADIERLLPRVMDVLNTYLSSLDLSDIEDPASLLILRSQMRRRIDLVVGGDRVRDLLVLEFVVS